MKLVETGAQVARLVAEGQTKTVRYAATRGTGSATELASGAEGDGDPYAPVDWMCAGKPVISYAALRAVRSANCSCDDDIRPFVPAAALCPEITLREILTYRSGLTKGDREGWVRCVTDPPLSRPKDWNPTVDAEYWNAGWEILPALVRTTTGHEFEDYVTGPVLESQFSGTGAFLRQGMAEAYLARAWIDSLDIRKVFLPVDLATSLCGPLVALCSFYRGLLEELGTGSQSDARILTSSNPGPDFFRRGVSAKLRWALGFPHLLRDQGFEFSVPPDGFGSQGAVLTLTPRGLQYAWVCVAGAIPSLGFTFAVAMDKLRPVPDRRYLEVVDALMRDARAS